MPVILTSEKFTTVDFFGRKRLGVFLWLGYVGGPTYDLGHAA